MSESVRIVELSDDTVRGIELLAESLQRPCYVVDLAGCVDKVGLLERTARALAFPGWFGHNWDAWFDCLVDLGWQPRYPDIDGIVATAWRWISPAPMPTPTKKTT